jgi:hypothetical protein
VEQFPAEHVLLHFTHEDTPWRFVIIDGNGDGPGHTGLANYTLELGSVTLESPRFKAVTEKVGGGNAAAAQKSRFLPRNGAGCTFQLEDSHLSSPF